MTQPAITLDDAAGFRPWRMQVRDHLNPASSERIFRVGFIPPETGALTWQAGDIAEIEMPDGRRRSYSISSMPSEGRLDLLVRETLTADGGLGYGTACLLHDTQPGHDFILRVRPNHTFRAPDGNGPLLLVGAGSGLAGLRPHILEATTAKRPVWLVYGERHGDSQGRLCRELQNWHLAGHLYRLNLAFSHPDAGQGHYVQDVLSQYAGDIRAFMGRDGATMVCGGRALGAAVDATLAHVLGDAWMGSAVDDGRYRQALF